MAFVVAVAPEAMLNSRMERRTSQGASSFRPGKLQSRVKG
jgi:hypothetical protein